MHLFDVLWGCYPTRAFNWSACFFITALLDWVNAINAILSIDWDARPRLASIIGVSTRVYRRYAYRSVPNFEICWERVLLYIRLEMRSIWLTRQSLMHPSTFTSKPWRRQQITELEIVDTRQWDRGHNEWNHTVECCDEWGHQRWITSVECVEGQMGGLTTTRREEKVAFDFRVFPSRILTKNKNLSLKLETRGNPVFGKETSSDVPS